MDAYAENVWYVEVRFAPMRHVNPYMDGRKVIACVDRGLDRAEKATGGNIVTGIVICAMRNFVKDMSNYHADISRLYQFSTTRELAQQVSLETARLAVACRQEGINRIVGFDLAGPEKNYPPHHHAEAFHEIMNSLMNITVHAGEAYGPPSVQQAVTYLSAHRIGHGTRLCEKGGEALLEYVRDHRILIEICLTSNLQTGAARSLASHPFRALLDREIRVSLCTDNRLISNTTVTDELLLAHRAFGMDASEIRRTLLYGFKAAFLPYDERRRLLLKARAALRQTGIVSNDGYN
jgi:adenosine deaminase